MKKIYSVILCLLMTFTLLGVFSASVKADEATLSELKVQARSSAGNLTDVTITPAFSPEITEYQATVMNDTIRLAITATATEEDAVVETDWEAMDVGDNKTYVYVTSADGTKTTYTIYTKRLTEDEEATYVPESNPANGGNTNSKSNVKVNGVKMNITSNFTTADIPEGFSETEYTYKKNTYRAIKGDKKELVALWLEPETSSDGETETGNDTAAKGGFYIYDETAKSFYAMNNIYIKSRMYTVVKREQPDEALANYEVKQVTIIDQTVDAWVMDESNRLYLVYAMNWEGETNLYCYDDVEKCFQRYIIENTAYEQIDAANESINTLQNKNNELVQKFNDSNSRKWKVIAILLVIIVILFFVILNLSLKLRMKKILYGDDENGPKESKKKKDSGRKEKEEEFYEEQYEYDANDDDEEEELFMLVDDEEDEEDFVMVTHNDKSKQSGSEEFDIGKDEIDISAQIIREMKEKEKVEEKNQEKSYGIAKEEPMNEEALKDILSTAFPEEDKDDTDEDGFTFI